jgi:hypothetical protein
MMQLDFELIWHCICKAVDFRVCEILNSETLNLQIFIPGTLSY